MYLDYAEFQASRGKPMYMKDWTGKLNAFLKFNEQDILQNSGKGADQDGSGLILLYGQPSLPLKNLDTRATGVADG